MTRKSWQAEQIAECKRQVRDALAAAYAPADFRGRLQHAFRRISELADDLSPDSQLERLVYVMNALVIGQKRPRTLSAPQVRRLSALATGILQSQGIKPRTSRLSFLYSELHTVLSQIHRQTGNQWGAAWEQNVAVHFGRNAFGPENGFESLAMANRALRLGHVRLTLDKLDEAQSLGLSPANGEKALLSRMKTLRLARRYDEALALSLAAIEHPDLSPPALAELTWEHLCAEVQRDGDYARLAAAVTRGKPHWSATYLVEAALWLRSIADTALIDRLPAMRWLARVKDLQIKSQGLFFKAALQLERCYDYASPLHVRQRQLGAILVRAGMQVSIDKEMLLWAASARWLARSKSYTLASLALNEYETISLRLTLGASPDVLGVAGDLLAKDWYAGTTRAAQLSEEKGGVDAA